MGSQGAPGARAPKPGRALSVHLAALVVVPGCLALGWWQVTRALDGNSLSWVYSVEWPFFAAYAVYMWWKLIHEEPVRHPWRRGSGLGPPGLEAAGAPGGGGADTTPTEAGPGPNDTRGGPPDPGDEELERYNRYLEELNASGRRKRW